MNQPAHDLLSTLVGHDEFVEAVRPYCEMLRRQMSAGNGSRNQDPAGSGATATADSEAMAELANQAALAGEWDDTPVDTAITHIGLLLTAAEDAMKTLAEVIVAAHTPLFSHQLIARGGLECLALAHWLAERGIGARERVRRSLNERIQSAYEQSRLPARLNPEPDRQRRLLAATALGFERTRSRKGSLTFLSPRPPSITARVQRLLGHAELGVIVYSFASAIAHGTMWGLLERVETPENPANAPVVTAMLTTSVQSIATPAVILIAAHRAAYAGYVGYMGWDDSAWIEVSDEVWQAVGRYIEAVNDALQ